MYVDVLASLSSDVGSIPTASIKKKLKKSLTDDFWLNIFRVVLSLSREVII